MVTTTINHIVVVLINRLYLWLSHGFPMVVPTNCSVFCWESPGIAITRHGSPSPESLGPQKCHSQKAQLVVTHLECWRIFSWISRDFFIYNVYNNNMIIMIIIIMIIVIMITNNQNMYIYIYLYVCVRMYIYTYWWYLWGLNGWTTSNMLIWMGIAFCWFKNFENNMIHLI